MNTPRPDEPHPGMNNHINTLKTHLSCHFRLTLCTYLWFKKMLRCTQQHCLIGRSKGKKFRSPLQLSFGMHNLQSFGFLLIALRLFTSRYLFLNRIALGVTCMLTWHKEGTQNLLNYSCQESPRVRVSMFPWFFLRSFLFLCFGFFARGFECMWIILRNISFPAYIGFDIFVKQAYSQLLRFFFRIINVNHLGRSFKCSNAKNHICTVRS